MKIQVFFINFFFTKCVSFFGNYFEIDIMLDAKTCCDVVWEIHYLFSKEDNFVFLFYEHEFDTSESADCKLRPLRRYKLDLLATNIIFFLLCRV